LVVAKKTFHWIRFRIPSSVASTNPLYQTTLLFWG
jgi:hypothetical protein